MDAEYDAQTGVYIVRGTLDTTVCNTKGEPIGSFPLPQRSCVEFSFSDVLQAVPLDNESRKDVTTLSELFGFEHMQIQDRITSLCYSRTAPYIYVGTLQKLFCVNTHSYTIGASIGVPFGVRKIQELGKDALIVTNWDSVELIKLQQDG